MTFTWFCLPRWMVWFWFFTFCSGLPARRNNGVGLGVKMAFGQCWPRCSNAWGRTRWGICQRSKWICLCRSYESWGSASCYWSPSSDTYIPGWSKPHLCHWPVFGGQWDMAFGLQIWWLGTQKFEFNGFCMDLFQFCVCANLKTWIEADISNRRAIYYHFYVNQWSR